MANALRFHPEVANDLKAATTWYDQISIDLGNRFRRAVDSRFDSIEVRPESFGRVEDKLRAARVQGFPYLVVFQCDLRFVEILGVYHAAGDPEKWNWRRR